MTDKPQSSAPYSQFNPLICDQPLNPVDRRWMTDDELLLDQLFAEIERINANEIPPIAERIGQEGGVSKIARDPRPRLFGAPVVSLGGWKTLGARLIAIGLSARKMVSSSGGRGEGRCP